MFKFKKIKQITLNTDATVSEAQWVLDRLNTSVTEANAEIRAGQGVIIVRPRSF